MNADIKTAPHDLVHLMPALTRLARILAPRPDLAEDLAQDALLRVLARLNKGAEIDDLRPYLMTTLRNGCTKCAPQDQELTEQNSPSHDGEIWPRFACADVADAISRLPDEQAALLRLLALHGASYAELAAAFKLPIGTVMSRISRARAQLRGELGLPKSSAVEMLLPDA
jgi:RNA polymerase sigma-70 factor (ECF subfamily)